MYAADPRAQLTVTYSTFSTELPIEQVEHSPALDQLAVRYRVASPRSGIGAREPMSDGRERIELRRGTPARARCREDHCGGYGCRSRR